MEFVENDILQVLCTLPNECAYLDYKVIPYQKPDYPELIRDVISMLNTDEAIGKNKVIIFGVDDSHNRIGIDTCLMDNDANYQNLFNKIKPRPHILTGTVDYENKKYGFIYIFADNNDRVYEVAEIVYGDKEKLNIKSFAVCQGQAFSRHGSQKYIMMREHRDHLNSVKIQPEYNSMSLKNNAASIVDMSPDTALLSAAILGGWSEEYPNDIALLEQVVGESYSLWIKRLYKLRTSMPETVICNGTTWNIKDRVAIFAHAGKYLYDLQVDLLCSQFLRLASYHDPRYNLSPDRRFASGVYGEKRFYSKILTHCFTEFWTIANVNEGIFTSVSKYKIKQATNQLVESVLNSNDWKTLASFEGEFQLLAEAAPEHYMRTIQQRLRNNESGLVQYFQESETGVVETKYGTPLYRSLAVLARFPYYFSDACYTLMLIARVNRDALSTITGVMLPWCPQTSALLSIRKGLLAGLMEVDQELGWELAISLLPGKTTIGFPAEDPLYLRGGSIPESVSNEDYWDVSIAYLSCVTSKAFGNVKRLLEIIDFFDEFPKEGFIIIYKFLNDSAAYIMDDIESRYLIWDTLLTFTTKHRRFSDATWALQEEILKQIDLIIDVYCPKNRVVQARRLFKIGQLDLIIEDDYETSRAKLRELQNEEIRYIWADKQLSGILEFVTAIDCADKVGVSLHLAGIILSNDETLKIVSLLTSENSKFVEFAKGYLMNLIYKNNGQAENVLRELVDDKIKARFLALFPLSIKNREYLDVLDPDAQNLFWREVSQYNFGITNSNDLDYIVDELIKHSRSVDAIVIIVGCIHNRIEPTCDCVFEALCGSVNNSQNLPQHAIYEISQAIKWMQKHENDEKRLFIIEWQYLNILTNGYDVEPITLYKTLSNEPHFFIEALTHAFKGRHEPLPDLEEEEQKIAKHFNALLFYWRRTPGLQDDGTLNEEEFVSWMCEVSSKSRELDRYEVAMNLIGKTFFHSPKDQSGLFINILVASTLQNDDDGYLLSGYSSESVNSRGVHSVDPTGAPEFALEQKYRERANEIDSLGMFRFAKVLRQIADRYKEEALENIREHQTLLQENV